MQGVLTTSWDDGGLQDLRLAELLAAHGLSGTFYVPRKTEFPGIGPVEMRALQDMGFEVGAHTLTHRDIVLCRDEEARTEVAGSKEWVESVTGRACSMFCFPRGRFCTRDLGIAAKAGFLGVRSVEYLSTDWPREREGIFLMATTVQAVRQTRAMVLKNLVSRGRWKRLLIRLPEVFCSGDWTDVGLRLAKEVRDDGGVFHLWGHSWEIERAGVWDNIDHLCRSLADMFAPEARMTNGEICERAVRQTQDEK